MRLCRHVVEYDPTRLNADRPLRALRVLHVLRVRCTATPVYACTQRMEDEDGVFFRQILPYEQPWTATTTWISKDGLVRNQHFNTWTDTWEWGHARVPTLVGDRLFVNLSLRGTRRRLTLEHAIPCAWSSTTSTSDVAVAKDASRAIELDNLRWRVTQRRRSVSFHPVRETWCTLRYVLYDHAGTPCQEYRPCRHGEWECSTAGRMRVRERHVTRLAPPEFDTEARARVWIRDFGWAYVDKAVVFTHVAVPPRAFRTTRQVRFPTVRDAAHVLDPARLTDAVVAAHVARMRRNTSSWWETLYHLVLTTPMECLDTSFWTTVLSADIMQVIRTHFENRYA